MSRATDPESKDCANICRKERSTSNVSVLRYHDFHAMTVLTFFRWVQPECDHRSTFTWTKNGVEFMSHLILHYGGDPLEPCGEIRLEKLWPIT